MHYAQQQQQQQDHAFRPWSLAGTHHALNAVLAVSHNTLQRSNEALEGSNVCITHRRRPQALQQQQQQRQQQQQHKARLATADSGLDVAVAAV
jgi:DNA-binding transcriptional regulator YhcF (GntR family)